jgi:predicted CopG family antitoxin
MPGKTINVDPEAYRLLATARRGRESFSSVIKRHFKQAPTAQTLLASLGQVALSDETLDIAEEIVRQRHQSPANSPILGPRS